MKHIITIKDTGEIEPNWAMARFTIYQGTFPNRKAIGFASTSANAELIAKALIKHYVTAELKHVFGKPDPEGHWGLD